MKHFVFLSLLTVLSGCASSTVEEKETNSAVVTTARAAPAKVKKTPTAYMTEQEKELKQVIQMYFRGYVQLIDTHIEMED